MAGQLEGRRALVTGAGRGIGRAIALDLARQGADVAVNHLDDPAAAEVATEVGRLRRRAVLVPGDMGSASARIAASAAERLGGHLEILVANASIQIPQDLAATSEAAAGAQFAVNLMGTLSLVQAVTPSMAAAGWGRIVTIGSVQQWRPHPRMLIYAALKSGVENLVRNLAGQLAGSGITINNIAPGAIETDRNHEALADPGYRAAILARIPAGRLGRPEDCAGIVSFLCSAAGAYITGANIPVDGGMRLG